MKNLAQRFPVYNKVLSLYPFAYRKRYREQMLQTLADMLDGASTPVAKANVWLRTVVDLPLSIAQQQLHYTSEAFVNDTAPFVKRNTFISGCLFIPFFVFVIVNDATAHGLYHTWLWDFGVLLTWILLLPLAGLLLSAATMLMWLIQNQRNRKQSWAKSLRDIRHNWPMSLPIVLGLAILGVVLFHDSVHCVLGNPLREARNLSATWRCVRRG